MKDIAKRVDRIVCCENGKSYSKTVVLLGCGSRVEFTDSKHPDWVNLRAGDTVEIYREYHSASPEIRQIEYELDA